MQWKPIETYFTEGFAGHEEMLNWAVLVYCPNELDDEICITSAYWAGNAADHGWRPLFRELFDAGQPPLTPTHWMPLPAAPEVSK